MQRRSRWLYLGIGAVILFFFGCSLVLLIDKVQVDRYMARHNIELTTLDKFVISQVEPGMPREQVHEKIKALGRVTFYAYNEDNGEYVESARLQIGLLSSFVYIFTYDPKGKLLYVVSVS